MSLTQNQLTVVYSMMSLSDGNTYWTPEVLAQALLGIWFAASHQPWMVKDPVPCTNTHDR